jgi:hypothetical protein
MSYLFAFLASERVEDDSEEDEATDGVYRSQLGLRGSTSELVVAVYDRSWCTPIGAPTRHRQRSVDDEKYTP